MDNYSSCPGRRNGRGLVFLFLYAVSRSTLFPFLAALIFRPTTISCQPNHTPETSDADDFRELLKNELYVDKTLLIEDFAIGRGDVIQITRPPGWGKTTNLKMLQKFLAIELDRKGVPLPKEQRVNAKWFTGFELDLGAGEYKELKPLKIAKRFHIMNLQGQYPLIFVSFKTITGSSYPEIVDQTKNLIANAFRDHFYLKDTLTADDKQNYDLYSAGEVNELELEYGLKILSMLVGKRFKQTVYIFIDDYDTPLNDLFVNLVVRFRRTLIDMTDNEIYAEAFQSPDYRKTFAFFQGILNKCFKNNDVLRRGLLSGVFVQLSSNLIESFDKVSKYDVLSKHYSKYFGFTKNEVDDILNNAVYRSNSAVFKEWYGYNFTGNTTYNPWSTRHFVVNNNLYDPYWTDCSNRSLAYYLLDNDHLQPSIQRLADGGIVKSAIHDDIRYDRVTDDLSVFLYSGYLTPVEYDASSKVWKLSIANEEIRKILKNKILAWICGKMKIKQSDFATMAKNLTEFALDDFEARLLSHLSASPTPLTNGNKVVPAEVICSAILRGLAYSFGVEYVPNGHKPPGTDQVTMMVLPRRGLARKSFVIEGSVSRNADNLKEQAENQLGQIHERFDRIIRRDLHRNQSLKLVLVFHGNNVGIAHKIENF